MIGRRGFLGSLFGLAAAKVLAPIIAFVPEPVKAVARETLGCSESSAIAAVLAHTYSNERFVAPHEQMLAKFYDSMAYDHGKQWSPPRRRRRSRA